MSRVGACSLADSTLPPMDRLSSHFAMSSAVAPSATFLMRRQEPGLPLSPPVPEPGLSSLDNQEGFDAINKVSMASSPKLLIVRAAKQERQSPLIFSFICFAACSSSMPRFLACCTNSLRASSAL